MKKLALVLGSLLVVGTAASAKEVVPAPVVVPEKVVEVVEKPVIVYRDREVEQGWRPNGSVDVQYRWYGETEGMTAKQDTDGDWARSRSNAGRLQTTTNINFTENQNLNIRTRNYQSLRGISKGPGSWGLDDKDNEKWNATAGSDELRIRHHYNFGTIGDSKVNATSRLEYKQAGNNGAKEAAASVAFDFANYFFSNDYFKVDTFAVRPIYVYKWNGHDNDAVTNQYGLNLETEYSLPFGFTAEFNIKSGYARKASGHYFYTKDGKHRNNYYADVEAYLYNTTNLYKNGAFAVDFIFEGGFDPYTFNQRKMINVAQADSKGGTIKAGELTGDTAQRREYTLYAEPAIKFSYKPTDFVTAYAAAGATYSNWAVTAANNAKNWRWQPTAWAGVKVSF